MKQSELVKVAKKVYGERKLGAASSWLELMDELSSLGISDTRITRLLKANKKLVEKKEIVAARKHNKNVGFEDYNPKGKEFLSLLGCVNLALEKFEMYKRG